MSVVTFFAAGEPKPKGSHRAFVVKTAAGPRAVMAGDSKGERGWRESVTAAARDAMAAASWPPLEGPVELVLEFYVGPRPKSHLRSSGALKPGVPGRPPKKPDADKLMRSVGDALNGICWRDDAQVVEAVIRKRYTNPSQPYVGVRVTLRPFVGA